MEMVKLAAVEDFSHRRIKTYAIRGRKIGIVKREDGTFFAVEVQCKHQGADLTMGRLNGMVLTCPRHGWQYDLESGACLNRVSAPLRRYAVEVVSGEIRVSLTPLEQDGNPGQ